MMASECAAASIHFSPAPHTPTSPSLALALALAWHSCHPQWTSYNEPDHCGAQFKCMTPAVLHIVKAKGWDLASTRVWCDFISIPQRCKGMQLLAINSLASYAACAHAFCIVAPPVIHGDTGLKLDLATYNTRMWCRLENLCHWLRHGNDNRWLATDEVCQQMTDEIDLINSSLRVFEGEATIEAAATTCHLPPPTSHLPPPTSHATRHAPRALIPLHRETEALLIAPIPGD